MATKRFYATRDMKNPTNYGTRMLRAGDPVDLDGPKARLYLGLKAVTAQKPRSGNVIRTDLAALEANSPAPATVKTHGVPDTPKPAAAPRKRKAAKKK
jgi:hypothetical protein